MKLRDLLEEGKPMNTKTFIKAVKDEFDIEALELMKSVIDTRIHFLNKMGDMANPRTVVKGFGRR